MIDEGRRNRKEEGRLEVGEGKEEWKTEVKKRIERNRGQGNRGKEREERRREGKKKGKKGERGEKDYEREFLSFLSDPIRYDAMT